MPERTAITNGLSYSAKQIVKDFKEGATVLDYGSGKLRNSRYLSENKLIVDVLDTQEQISTYEETFMRNTYSSESNISNKYDAILCSFVLNVVPDLNARLNILSHMKNLLSDNGSIYLETRSDDRISESKTSKPFKDGYLLGVGQVKTFQKKIDLEELGRYTLNVGLTVSCSKKLSSSSFMRLQK